MLASQMMVLGFVSAIPLILPFPYTTFRIYGETSILRERAHVVGHQKHREFPGSLPSKYYPGAMLLNFSVQMGTGVSNTAAGLYPI